VNPIRHVNANIDTHFGYNGTLTSARLTLRYPSPPQCSIRHQTTIPTLRPSSEIFTTTDDRARRPRRSVLYQQRHSHKHPQTLQSSIAIRRLHIIQFTTSRNALPSQSTARSILHLVQTTLMNVYMHALRWSQSQQLYTHQKLVPYTTAHFPEPKSQNSNTSTSRNGAGRGGVRYRQSWR